MGEWKMVKLVNDVSFFIGLHFAKKVQVIFNLPTSFRVSTSIGQLFLSCQKKPLADKIFVFLIDQIG